MKTRAFSRTTYTIDEGIATDSVLPDTSSSSLIMTLQYENMSVFLVSDKVQTNAADASESSLLNIDDDSPMNYLLLNQDGKLVDVLVNHVKTKSKGDFFKIHWLSSANFFDVSHVLFHLQINKIRGKIYY